MANLRVVESEAAETASPQPSSMPIRLIVQWVIAVLVAFGLGTWLVWWAAYSQRHFAMEEIRTACQRVMPETIERCVDTVIIQRGGARR